MVWMGQIKWRDWITLRTLTRGKSVMKLKLYFNDGTTLIVDKRKFNPELFKLCGGVMVEKKTTTWMEKKDIGKAWKKERSELERTHFFRQECLNRWWTVKVKLYLRGKFVKEVDVVRKFNFGGRTHLFTKDGEHLISQDSSVSPNDYTNADFDEID